MIHLTQHYCNLCQDFHSPKPRKSCNDKIIQKIDEKISQSSSKMLKLPKFERNFRISLRNIDDLELDFFNDFDLRVYIFKK